VQADGATIVCDGVSRWFGSLVAVSDVSLRLGPGVTALLGPNGAGKSTLLRMIVGLLPTSSGTVEVLGADPRTDLSVRGRIGMVPQQDALFDRLGALAAVRLAATLHGVPDGEEAARGALSDVDLDPDDPRPVGGYSKGMRQRVKVAQALVHRPAVLLLDEPLAGLDPVQRRRAIAHYRELGESGVTVVVSSHVLEEVARIGSDVIVIAEGRLAAAGDFHALRELMDDRPHRIRIRTDRTRVLARELLALDAVVGVRVDGDALVVDSVDADTFGRAIAPIAREVGATLREVAPLDDDLEAVFRYVVDRR
jgi:ABC-2 type transport system ATP-binding protein